MKKKILVVLCIAAMLVTIGLVSAVLSTHYDMPQTGTPSGSNIPGTITLNADASVSGLQSWTSSIVLTST